ncbi:hypothetical protein ACJX0J_025869, partial [Zea mays]
TQVINMSQKYLLQDPNKLGSFWNRRFLQSIFRHTWDYQIAPRRILFTRPHLKAANLNYFVSIFGCKKGGLRNNDWKMIEENLAMFMLSFFEDGIWQSIDTVAITSSKEIGMGTKNVGFNVIFNKECLVWLTELLYIKPTYRQSYFTRLILMHANII